MVIVGHLVDMIDPNLDITHVNAKKMIVIDYQKFGHTNLVKFLLTTDVQNNLCR